MKSWKFNIEEFAEYGCFVMPAALFPFIWTGFWLVTDLPDLVFMAAMSYWVFGMVTLFGKKVRERRHKN